MHDIAAISERSEGLLKSRTPMYLADNIADNVSLGMGSITLEKYAHLRYLYDDESDDSQRAAVCAGIGKIVTASAGGEDISGVSLGLKIVF